MSRVFFFFLFALFCLFLWVFSKIDMRNFEYVGGYFLYYLVTFKSERKSRKEKLREDTEQDRD